MVLTHVSRKSKFKVQWPSVMLMLCNDLLNFNFLFQLIRSCRPIYLLSRYCSHWVRQLITDHPTHPHPLTHPFMSSKGISQLQSRTCTYNFIENTSNCWCTKATFLKTNCILDVSIARNINYNLSIVNCLVLSNHQLNSPNL